MLRLWGSVSWDRNWLTSGNMLLRHLCYHANFGHSRSNRASVIMEMRQKILASRVRLFKVLEVTDNDTD